MAVSLSVPIMIERFASENEPAFYSVRPVFFAGSFEARHRKEARAVRHLEETLRKELGVKARESRHDCLIDWSFHPKLARHQFSLTVKLRRRTWTGRVFFVVFESLQRRVGYCPKASLAFEWDRGESLESRAAEVLAEWFRRNERSGDSVEPDQVASPGFVRLSQIDLSVANRPKLKPEWEREPFAEIAGSERMNGMEELERVGRCLDRAFPNELQRAVYREEEVRHLERAFARPPRLRAPLVLVGPSGAGKTAIIHEFWYRRLSRGKRSTGKGNLWLINPQRLISGMAFVGQWEERFLAIVRAIHRGGHVLLVDDLLGLFQAGRSSCSDLTVGHLLKVELQENPLSFIAEATPESWRKLRETDRAFGDLFQVVPVREPEDAETMKILIRVVQDLESAGPVRFGPEVLPRVIELQRRFVRTRAFPGKAVEMLQHLAFSGSADPVGIEAVRRQFQERTGINTAFLDSGELMPRSVADSFFRERIAGQKAALEAMVDVVTLTRARLQPPDKPLGSLLFLGPTGIGKTECAKALAEFLFGSSDRMLRLDMNEFVGYDSVGRLVGTPAHPQGLLTSAIRRNPYTIVLLDEIEKAHMDVFDLLLQVLGDGRLTDAAGRTADFCNAVVIMTSNLGARHSRVPLGFAPQGTDASNSYVEAAEAFFRPEFFNRLDRVIAFHELNESHLEGLVRRLVARALDRYGIRERRLVLDVAPHVYRLLVERGFEPDAGARALRRAVERHLMQPMAEELSSLPPDSLVSLHLQVEGGKIVSRHRQFRPAPAIASPVAGDPTISPAKALAYVRATNAFLLRADEILQASLNTPSEDDQMDRARYYALRELLAPVRRLRDRVQHVADAARDRHRRGNRRLLAARRSPRRRLAPDKLPGILERFHGSSDPATVFRELMNESVIADELSEEVENLARRVNRFNAIIADGRPRMASVQWQCTGNLLLLSEESERKKASNRAAYRSEVSWFLGYLRAFPESIIHPEALWADADGWGSGAEEWLMERSPHLREHEVTLSGPAADIFLKNESGIHLHYDSGGTLRYAQVTCGAATSADNAGVIRLHDVNGWHLDLRSGLLQTPGENRLWDYLVQSIPLANEFLEMELPENTAPPSDQVT